MARFRTESGTNKAGNNWNYYGTYNSNNDWHGLGTMFWGGDDYYFGEWTESNRTGYGCYYFSSGAVYMGHFVDTDQDGKGFYSFTNGDYYVGNWKANKRHGLGLYIYQNGDWFYGNYIEGQRNGNSVYYYAKTQTFDFKVYKNGEVVEEKTIDAKTGIAEVLQNFKMPLTAKNPSPFTYEPGKNSDGTNWEFNGQTNYGKWHGIGALEWDNNSYYYGEWNNGAKTGTAIYKFKTGNFYMGQFNNLQFEGRGMYLYSDGALYFCDYRNDKRNGLGFYIENDGTLYFGRFVDGSLTGFVLLVKNDMTVKYCTYDQNKYVSTEKEFPFVIRGGGSDSNGLIKDAPLDNNSFVNDNNNNNSNNNNHNVDEIMNFFGGIHIKDDNYNNNNHNIKDGNLGGPKNVKNGTGSSNNGNNGNVDEDPEKELEKLVGLKEVKRELKRIKAYTVKNKGKRINLHMVFNGNPGTGKTVVARLIGKILYKEGVLPTTNFVEGSRETLVAEYIGQTAVKTKEAIDKAMGGVLFIDEAYALNAHSKNDFGPEAISTLLKAMEDHRGEFCCIMAGYTNEMADLFKMNPGFESRVQFFVNFPDYSKEELIEIARLMIAKQEYTIEEEALKKVIDVVYTKKHTSNFANAREVRIILDQVEMIQAERTISEMDNREITLADVETYMNDHNIVIKEENKNNVPMIKLETLHDLYKDYVPATFEEKRIDIEEAVVSLKVSTKKGKSEGSGFIISPNGYVVTCAHCVNGATEIKVRRRVKDRHGRNVDVHYSAVIAAIDEKADVAVIKIVNTTDDYYTYVPLNPVDAEDLAPLHDILLLGYPFGVSRFDYMSINEGKVSSYQRHYDVEKPDLINIDITAKSGNSGSCVIDKETGYVIGVLCGSNLSRSGDLVEEVNYCRPISYVWDLIKNNQE